MKNLKLLALLSIIGITGCTGLNVPNNKTIPDKNEMVSELADQWSVQTPAMRKVKMKHGFIIDSPSKIPAEIANKRIEVEFSKRSTFDDFSGVLNTLGFYLSTPDETILSKPIVIYEYKGKFGDYLRSLALTHDLTFSYLPGNVILVEKERPYILQIPQHAGIADAIKENIEGMGAVGVKASVNAGAIHYKATERNQYRIMEMVKNMGLNAAVVSMQVAVVNVSLDRERNTGFDWGSLKLGLGAQDLDPPKQEAVNANYGLPANSTTDEKEIPPRGSNLKDMASFLGLSNQGLALNLAKGDFTFLSAFRMLSTYGETKTAQSVLMDSLSGTEVSIKSGQKIPYIESIGVNTSSSTSNANSLGSTEISEVDIGLELKLTPFFDNRSETVTIGVDLSLSSLLSYVKLSAGNQLGEISRPLTQEQAFTDLVRVKAGESIIIGGLTYDSVNDSRANLNFLEDTKTASQGLKVSRTAMFILMRPTVTVFEVKDNG